MERKVFHLFKHLLLAGSRVGTGNIAGVATAIVLGVPSVFGCGLSHLSELRVHL